MRNTQYYLLEPEDREALACIADAILVPIVLFTPLNRRGSEKGYGDENEQTRLFLNNRVSNSDIPLPSVRQREIWVRD